MKCCLAVNPRSVAGWSARCYGAAMKERPLAICQSLHVSEAELPHSVNSLAERLGLFSNQMWSSTAEYRH